MVYKYPLKPNRFYVPVYVRMKVNKIGSIDYIAGKATLGIDLRIWVMMKKFPEAVQE